MDAARPSCLSHVPEWYQHEADLMEADLKRGSSDHAGRHRLAPERNSKGCVFEEPQPVAFVAGTAIKLSCFLGALPVVGQLEMTATLGKAASLLSIVQA